MKKLVRIVSMSSILAFGAAAAVPVTAHAEPAEEVSSTAEALHAGERTFMERALDDVDLRPEQRNAIDKLKADYEKRHAPVKKAKHDFMLAVADQVEKGKVDRCALTPEIKSLVGAMAEAKPGDRVAFERLHEILNPEQRARFVDAVKRRYEAVKKEQEPKALTERMTKELGLNDDQKVRIGRILGALHEIKESEPGRAEHRERWSRILEAFKGERFDLDQIAPREDYAARGKRKVEGALWAAEAIVPALTPDQREKVARKIRDKVEGRAEGEEEEREDSGRGCAESPED